MKKKWGAILGIFIIFVMVASTFAVMFWGGGNQQQQGNNEQDIYSLLCQKADHPILYLNKTYNPCKEEQYDNCWDCINNKVYVR